SAGQAGIDQQQVWVERGHRLFNRRQRREAENAREAFAFQAGAQQVAETGLRLAVQDPDLMAPLRVKSVNPADRVEHLPLTIPLPAAALRGVRPQNRALALSPGE